jgi:uncharacterized membrane protein
MLKLESLEDLENLHTNQVMESATLEYKASAAVDQSKKDEIAKDIKMSNDQGNDQSNNRWAIILGAIGLLAIALLLLPPFPPWLRVVAVMLVVLAVLGGLGILARLRATWRRSVSDLPSDDQRNARWKRAFGLIGVLIVALRFHPEPGQVRPRPRSAESRHRALLRFRGL